MPRLTGRPRDVLAAITNCETLALFNPVLAVRLGRQHLDAFEVSAYGHALLLNGGGGHGGKPRDRKAAKAARVARRRNRRR